jgi:methyl-accepting chemotaxis protein
MNKIFRFLTIGWLCAILVLSPRLIVTVWAQETSDEAAAEEVKTIQALAQKGYLGDKKDFYLSAKSLTEDDITDALLKANEGLSALDLKPLKPGDATYQVQDLQALLSLIKEKAEDIRGRKVSEWKFQKRVEKMIALLSTDQAAAAPGTKQETAAPTQAPVPTATVTPIPGPNHEEWGQMKGDLKDLQKKLGDMEDAYQKKLDLVQKSNDDLRKSNDLLKTSDADQQEQLRLVKKLFDHVQADLTKTSDRLEEVSKKAQEKTLTDTELQQDLTVMHKDIRDNSQDISVLKQELVKMDKTDEGKNQSALDDLLGSKWVAGGALLLGVTALIVALTKK